MRFAALTHDLGKGTTPREEWPRHSGHEARSVELARALCERLRVPVECRDLALIMARVMAIVLLVPFLGGKNAPTEVKMGVGMTLTIARDLSREGIRINTIQPGIFNTPAMSRATPEMLQALGAMVPFPQRLGNAAEYASLALEMIRNGYFNGETVRLDGAIRMQPR